MYRESIVLRNGTRYACFFFFVLRITNRAVIGERGNIFEVIVSFSGCQIARKLTSPPKLL